MDELDVAASPELEATETVSTRLGGWQRLVSAALAIAFVGAGAAAVFETDNEVGAGALLALGAYFVIASILCRFPRLKLGENEIDPSEVKTATRRSEVAIKKAGAAEAQATDTRAELERAKAELARARAEAAKARVEAEEARAEAEEAKEGYLLRERGPVENWATGYGLQLDARLADLAAEYQTVRTEMSSGSARTEKMTKIVDRMIAVCRDPKFEPIDYVGLLSDSDRGLQLVGIAYAYARPEVEAVMPLADRALIADKPFSEYWAAKALRLVLRDRCDLLHQTLRQRIEARLRELPPGTDRARELGAILEACPE